MPDAVTAESHERLLALTQQPDLTANVVLGMRPPGEEDVSLSLLNLTTEAEEAFRSTASAAAKSILSQSNVHMTPLQSR